MKRLAPTIAAAVLVFIPTILFAQDTPLVPCNGPDCSACHLVSLGNTVINYVITLLAVIAVIMLVIAGFRLVTSGGDTAVAEQAKRMFTNVVIGIIIVLASWLIVDTVLVTITDRGGLEIWTTIECTQSPIEEKSATHDEIRSEIRENNPSVLRTYTGQFGSSEHIGFVQSCKNEGGKVVLQQGSRDTVECRR